MTLSRFGPAFFKHITLTIHKVGLDYPKDIKLAAVIKKEIVKIN